MNYLSILVALSLLLAGCSSANWYKGMQSREQARCLGVPESEYEDCMKHTKESYDEYQQKREALDK